MDLEAKGTSTVKESTLLNKQLLCMLHREESSAVVRTISTLHKQQKS